MISTGNVTYTLHYSILCNFHSFEAWFDFSNDDCTSQIVSQEKEHHILSMLHQVRVALFFSEHHYLLTDSFSIFATKAQDGCGI